MRVRQTKICVTPKYGSSAGSPFAIRHPGQHSGSPFSSCAPGDPSPPGLGSCALGSPLRPGSTAWTLPCAAAARPRALARGLAARDGPVAHMACGAPLAGWWAA